MRGGAAYSSGASYGGYVNGNLDSQLARTFDQAGPYGQVPGNVLIGAQGQNVIPPSQMPSAAQLALAQSGGKRKRKAKKGGFIGVLNQGLAPLSLVALNHMIGDKNKNPYRYSRRNHRR